MDLKELSYFIFVIIVDQVAATVPAKRRLIPGPARQRQSAGPATQRQTAGQNQATVSAPARQRKAASARTSQATASTPARQTAASACQNQATANTRARQREATAHTITSAMQKQPNSLNQQDKVKVLLQQGRVAAVAIVEPNAASCSHLKKQSKHLLLLGLHKQMWLQPQEKANLTATPVVNQ